MTAVRVVQPGFQTTIQDLGRFGYAHLGISASGAADALSLRIGNLLVGNSEGASALEMTLVGGEFEFEERCIIALTGSDFKPMLNGHQLPMWQSCNVPAGARLRLNATNSGSRCYLCVAGGFTVHSTLGSSSTHLLTKLGGLDGGALKKGDVLQVKQILEKSFRARIIDERVVSALLQKSEIHVTEGLQSVYFSSEDLDRFYVSTYVVSGDSNRMGLRLTGPKITHAGEAEIVTEGAPLGAVQIPQSGEPIVLFVEHQTTGGYPKIANVIGADMHVVGQLKPRDSIRFRKVTFAGALARLREQESLVQSIRSSPK